MAPPNIAVNVLARELRTAEQAYNFLERMGVLVDEPDRPSLQAFAILMDGQTPDRLLPLLREGRLHLSPIELAAQIHHLASASETLSRVAGSEDQTRVTNALRMLDQKASWYVTSLSRNAGRFGSFHHFLASRNPANDIDPAGFTTERFIHALMQAAQQSTEPSAENHQDVLANVTEALLVIGLRDGKDSSVYNSLMTLAAEEPFVLDLLGRMAGDPEWSEGVVTTLDLLAGTFRRNMKYTARAQLAHSQAEGRLPVDLKAQNRELEAGVLEQERQVNTALFKAAEKGDLFSLQALARRLHPALNSVELISRLVDSAPEAVRDKAKQK